MQKPSPVGSSSTWALIEAYVARYTSPLIDEAQAAAWLPRLRELALAVPPTDTEDARGMLSAGVRFMVEMTATASVPPPVDEVLDTERISRWAYRAVGSGLSGETVRHYTARLHRLERVRRGLPGRLRGVAVERTPSTPMSVDEVETVLEACRASDVAVLAAAVAALGAGRTQHEAVGGAVGRIGERWVFVSPDGVPFDVVPQLADAALEVAGVRVPAWSWIRVRRCADAAGIPLTGAAARQTFRLMALSVDAPVGALLVRFGLTKEALIKIQPFLPDIAPEQAKALLRGRVHCGDPLAPSGPARRAL